MILSAELLNYQDPAALTTRQLQYKRSKEGRGFGYVSGHSGVTWGQKMSVSMF